MHKHNWTIINQFETESKFEQVRNMGYKPTTWESMNKKYVTDFQCCICGKLIRKVVKN